MKTVLTAALLTALLALVGVVLAPPEVFFSCDGGSKYILTRALVDHDPAWPALPYPGAAFDPDGAFFPIRGVFSVRQEDGRFVSAFPVYFPILSAPGLGLLGPRGLLVVPLAGGFVGMLLLDRIGRLLGWSGRRRIAGICALALATPFGFYSATFWEHAPAAALMLAGIAAPLPSLVSAPPRVPGSPGIGRREILGGFLLGLAGLLRPETLIASTAFLVSAALARGARRALILASVGMALAIVFIAVANLVTYGHVAGPQLEANLEGPRLQRAFIVIRLICGKNLDRIWTLAALAALAAGIFETRPARALRLTLAPVLLVPVFQALTTQTFPLTSHRSLTGILETSPFFFLAAFGLGRAHGRTIASGEDPGGRLSSWPSGLASEPAGRTAMRPVGLPALRDRTPAEASSPPEVVFGRAAVLSALAIILLSPVEGGPQGGSRFLLPSIILALISVLHEIGGPARGWRRIALATALVLSFPLSSRALPFLVNRLESVGGAALGVLQSMPAEVVVYRDPVFAQEMAATWFEKISFLARSTANLEYLVTPRQGAGAQGARAGAFSNDGFVLFGAVGSEPPPRVVGPPQSRWVLESTRRTSAFRLDLYRRSAHPDRDVTG